MPDLSDVLPGAVPVSPETVDSAPVSGGAYLLLLRLPGPVTIAIGKIAGELPGGWYAYAGSARGPGGIRARLRRHFRRDKRLHWHIDRLTTLADRLSAFAVPGGNECALRRLVADSGLGAVAIPGFGSSDCAACPAHLLRWSDPAPPV